jgi:predicted NAD-dependent protein-ADP-ribosyltransferase YbiA (DUF1768 family)
MSLPVPRHVLEELESALSNMKCKPSNLPKKLETIEICDGEYRIYFDGNLCILVKLPVAYKEGVIVDEGSIYGFFYTNSFSMFAGTFCKGSETMPVLIGDGFYYIPCGEALFHMMKAAQFKDWDSFKKIYYAATPRECKAAGNKVQNFVDAEWSQKAGGYMEEIARLKLQCPDVFTVFGLIAETADTHGIPKGNTYFYESTCNDKRYGTGLDINEMVQYVFKRDDAMQQAVEPITSVKLGGLCYPGENLLGNAVTKSFKLYLELADPDRSIEEMMAAYKTRYGKSFYETTLAEVVFDAKKKLKLEDLPMEDMPMEGEDAIPIFSDVLPRTPTPTGEPARAGTPVDARSFSVRTLSEADHTCRTYSDGRSFS